MDNTVHRYNTNGVVHTNGDDANIGGGVNSSNTGGGMDMGAVKHAVSVSGDNKSVGTGDAVPTQNMIMQHTITVHDHDNPVTNTDITDTKRGTKSGHRHIMASVLPRLQMAKRVGTPDTTSIPVTPNAQDGTIKGTGIVSSTISGSGISGSVVSGGTDHTSYLMIPMTSGMIQTGTGQMGLGTMGGTVSAPVSPRISSHPMHQHTWSSVSMGSITRDDRDRDGTGSRRGSARVGSMKPVGVGMGVVSGGTGGRYRAVAEYMPVLPDEIRVRVGDVVKITRVFKDDWVHGINETESTTGMFPRSCYDMTVSVYTTSTSSTPTYHRAAGSFSGSANTGGGNVTGTGTPVSGNTGSTSTPYTGTTTPRSVHATVTSMDDRRNMRRTRVHSMGYGGTGHVWTPGLVLDVSKMTPMTDRFSIANTPVMMESGQKQLGDMGAQYKSIKNTVSLDPNYSPNHKQIHMQLLDIRYKDVVGGVVMRHGGGGGVGGGVKVMVFVGAVCAVCVVLAVGLNIDTK